jgi:hypothetical protein
MLVSINQNIKLILFGMKNVNNLFIIALIGVSGMIACSNNRHQSAEMSETPQLLQSSANEEKNIADKKVAEMAEPAAETKEASPAGQFAPPAIIPNFVASEAASSTFDDGVHKFIRTAQTKIKVKDVVSATRTVEDIALRNKGFIVKSTVMNENLSSETINISQDSAIIRYACNLVSTINLKVPASSLDTVLRQIAPLALLVDYRTVEAEDVTVKLMADQLAQIRLSKKQKRISNAISATGRRLNDVMGAENALDEALEEADNKVISEYITNEQIAYSAVTVSLYQDRIEYSEKVSLPPTYKPYTPGFGHEFTDALSGGWTVLCAIFLFLVNIWPLLILLAIGVVVYLKIRKRNGRTDK